MQHSVEKAVILSHQRNISSNQLFKLSSNLFSIVCKTVTLTKFLPKIREREFNSIVAYKIFRENIVHCNLELHVSIFKLTSRNFATNW